jgi:hypothetical protein
MLLTVFACISTQLPSHDGDNFGTVVCALSDVNGDSVGDWAVSDPWGPGVVEMHSGKSGALIWKLPSPNTSLGWGSCLAVTGDVNGDGVEDLAIGCSYGKRPPELTTDLFVVSGRDGATLRAFTERPATGSGVSTLVGGLDLNGDAVPDFVVGQMTSKEHRQIGAIEAWSGKSGSRLWITPGTERGWVGYMLAAGVDFNGDGVADVATIAHSEHLAEQELILLSGKDGSKLDTWPNPSPKHSLVALAMLPAAEKGGSLIAALAGEWSGKTELARLVSFQRGQHYPVWSKDLGDAVGDIELALSTSSDVSGDGARDVVLGHRFADFFSGRVQAFDGVSHQTLWMTSGKSDSDLGVCLSGGHDFDGDGRGDIVVGADTPYNRMKPGFVLAISGASGHVLYEVGRSR